MDKCPCCEREFNGLEDFPLVQVVSFRLEKPLEQLSHVVEDWQIYVDPLSQRANSKVPAEVLELFKTVRENIVHYDGWGWKRDYTYENGEYFYKKFQEISVKVPEQLVSYVSKLESLVGKEVVVKDLLPPFQKDNYFKWAFTVPESDKYALSFVEDQENPGENRRTQLNLLGEGPNFGSAGGPTLEVLATIASLEYKGIVKK